MKPKPTTINLRGTVDWEYCYDASASKWIGICDSFKITVQADSVKELYSLIPESINEILREMMKTNDLSKFLREHGWTPEPRQKHFPARSRNVFFDIPINTRKVSMHDLQRALPC